MQRHSGLLEFRVEADDPKLEKSYQPGERIPKTGIYRVHHYAHRLSHEVTLLEGEKFPSCSSCAGMVRFELLAAAPEIARDASFRIRVQGLGRAAGKAA